LTVDVSNTKSDLEIDPKHQRHQKSQYSIITCSESKSEELNMETSWISKIVQSQLPSRYQILPHSKNIETILELLETRLTGV
jgi:hypothetical protein